MRYFISFVSLILGCSQPLVHLNEAPIPANQTINLRLLAEVPIASQEEDVNRTIIFSDNSVPVKTEKFHVKKKILSQNLVMRMDTGPDQNKDGIGRSIIYDESGYQVFNRTKNKQKINLKKVKNSLKVKKVKLQGKFGIAFTKELALKICNNTQNPLVVNIPSTQRIT